MSSTETWQSTACILCSINCGLEVQVQNGHLTRIRGDRSHPASSGYLCQKAARLDHYQNHARRLTRPLRRRADGSFEPIEWDTAIREVAEKLVRIRDAHGGHSIAYYGGGGQGNHLGGAYAGPFRAALGSPFLYNSLAQEKTGDFWANGHLFGRQTCHLTESIEETDYALIIGANPWHAHGIPRAREVIRHIAREPGRTLVVVDPRRTETAQLADLHLQVRPGMDAFLMAAMLGVIVQEELEDRDFVEARTVGFEKLHPILQRIPVDAFADRAGIDTALVRRVARDFARASSACTRHDLGVEHSLHSTLNTYLEKLLALITGNFGKAGGVNLHTQFVPLIGHSDDPDSGGATTRVTGMREISKLFPPNVLPAEIDTDHPERVRALFVDSANPLQSAADTAAYERAFDKLDLLVVVDVAETETAQRADYVLPASSQFEKWEATFFTLSFPTNYFHLRAPIVRPQGDTLPEPEIYRRLMVAMGALPARFPWLERIARQHRRWPKAGLLPMALALTFALRPRLRKYATTLLYATLGKALADEAAAGAVLWGASRFYAQRYRKQVLRSGLSGEGAMLGEALFDRILTAGTAVPLGTHTYEEMWQLVRHPDGKVHLAIPEMLEELRALESEDEARFLRDGFPFVLAAGERRAYNANQIYRDPAWRRKDPDGALRIHPFDASDSDLQEGQRVLCESATGAVEARVALDDRMRPGCLALPHGYGMSYADPERPDELVQNGPWINRLTAGDHCDPLARTPYHKYVPVRLRPVDG